jgi:hypothetical protein
MADKLGTLRALRDGWGGGDRTAPEISLARRRELR